MIELTHFARALTEWQTSTGMTQRRLAALIGCHESRLSQIRDGDRPGSELMRNAIAVAPEPWKALLKQARQADLDAADADAAAALSMA